MVDIKQASLDEATRGPAQSGMLGSLGGLQFIIGQVFTIIATILGVYLAGYVGFQRTLEYDRLNEAQRQVNLLQALHAELKDNTARLREFVPLMEKTQEGEAIYREWPRLRLFVWNASSQNSALFDAPSRIITDLQAFYEDASESLNNGTAREAFRHLTSSNTADRRRITEQFDARLKQAETAILPALERAAANAGQVVSRYADMAR
jgi:hypothetical protein